MYNNEMFLKTIQALITSITITSSGSLLLRVKRGGRLYTNNCSHRFFTKIRIDRYSKITFTSVYLRNLE